MSLKQLLGLGIKKETTPKAPYDECLEILKTGDFDYIKGLYEQGIQQSKLNVEKGHYETGEFQKKFFEKKEIPSSLLNIKPKSDAKFFIYPFTEFLIFASNQKQSLKKYGKIIRWLILQGDEPTKFAFSGEYVHPHQTVVHYILPALLSQKVLSSGIAECVLNAWKEKERLSQLDYIKGTLIAVASKKESHSLGLDNPKQKFSLKVLRNVSPKTIEKMLFSIQHDEDSFYESEQGNVHQIQMEPYEMAKKAVLKSTKNPLSPDVQKRVYIEKRWLSKE